MNLLKHITPAVLLSCSSLIQAQVPGLPIDPSQISSGSVNSGIYDVKTTDGQTHTGFIDSRVDSSGNGVIQSWPDGGPVTTTIVHDGNAVIFGPSKY